MSSSQQSGIEWLAREVVTSSSRASRGLFWLTLAGSFFAMAALGAIGDMLPESGKLVLGALAVPMVFILLIVQVKRWHDRDKSGWWVLINLLPCLGTVWVLVECGLLPGTPGPNRFGPDPTG